MKTNELINQTNSNFQVTAIGSSSADIDVLKKIISDLPLDSGRAYIIFENFSTAQTPNLADVLAAKTKIPVTEIVHHINVESNRIYVIPVNNFLIYEDGILQLKPLIRSSKTNNGFDIFFETVGSTFKSYSIGLILTWSPFDGSTGLKKLKEAGGSTIGVLSKKGFIQNAITSEYIDYFTPPDDIADKLLQIHERNLLTHSYGEKESTPDEKELLHQIIEILFLRTGTDFQHYKHTTLRRRIAKRMVVTKQETFEKYLILLRINTKEQDFLFDDLLISVTYFFRDQEVFDNLCQSIFPSLIENLTNSTLRCWSAGCSTGEEAYSLAICIHEYLEEINRNDIKVQIIASDLSEKCISKARLATYTAQDIKNISEKRLEKYFTKRDNSFHVNKVIRDMCVFAIHDLTKDAPFAKIDFVSCRNVLIYFDTDLQNQVLASFHYALRDKGFLFLGKPEWTQHVPHLFTTVNNLNRIYTRKTVEQFLPKKITRTDYNTSKINESSDPETNYRKIASDILLENYSPAAVIINEDLEIVHFHGDTSPFLQPAPGKPSFNILNMVREEWVFELRNNILKARNEKKNFSGEFTALTKQPFVTSFEIIYLPAYTDILLIILCKKNIASADSSSHHSPEMEKELLQLRGDFKRLTEEQQIYFEELQTTNEELVSSNEEMLQINQQLEHAAQELQSNNQELSCLNDELQNRREELASMHNFYESIVNTIKEPLLIIDKNFIIKSANPAFYNYFKTTEEQTEGHPIFDIGNSHWDIPAFRASVLKKVSSNEVVENFKIQFNFDIHGKKIMLVNAAPIVNAVPDGMILIALEDITDLEESHESLKNKNQELHNYNQQLESFTIAASDHLLEPIRKIYMFGKKVLDAEKELTETGKHNLNRLLSSAVNMNQLLEDLIDYSKINFGRKEFKKTDLNIVLKKVLSDLKSSIGKQKAEIEFNTLPSLLIIPSQMQQLLAHLISNAIKYAKQESSPKIKIGVAEVYPDELIDFGGDHEKQYIKLFISDNGIGFSKNYETLIFNPFYKLHNEGHYGSGLGLTLVQKIVYNHKGFIKISSEPNRGTNVYIYLPS